METLLEEEYDLLAEWPPIVAANRTAVLGIKEGARFRSEGGSGYSGDVMCDV